MAVGPVARRASCDICASSVNRLNAITEQLAQLDFAKVPPAEIGELKREQQAVYNSSLLHELYFECIGEAPTQPVRRVRRRR